jgi:hypothetical protein
MDYDKEQLNIIPGFIVPQKVYFVHGPYKRLPDIRFNINGVMGIRLANALALKFQLDDADAVHRLLPPMEWEITIYMAVRISVFS